MQDGTDAPLPMPLPKRAAKWLWRWQGLIWGTVVIGVVVNVGTGWLTSKIFDTRGTPLGWLLEHTWVLAAGVLVLVAQTAVAWWGQHTGTKKTMALPADAISRQRMLQALGKAYHDELEQSLQGVVRIALGMQERFDLTHPMRLLSWHSDHAERVYPEGTPIEDIFDHAGRGLLILGAPGAGKTTLLYELASVLVARAEKDEAQPVPVLLNLSSWGIRQPALSEWIVTELEQRYIIPRRLGARWLQEQRFLFLLDGLDEVKREARAACLKAINAFHLDQVHPLAMCSRQEEYEAEETRLTLQSAVLVQPLTTTQVQHYLKQGGRSLLVIRRVVRTNPVLLDLLSTPLMLSVLILAYRGTKTIKDLPQGGSPKTQQRHIFAHYLRRMLAARSDLLSYSSRSFQHSLCWLARQIQTRGQTVFYLEQLQPDWLEKPSALRLYRWGGIYLPAILIGISSNILINGLLFSADAFTILIGALIGWWQSQTLLMVDRKDMLLRSSTISFMKRGITSGIVGLAMVVTILLLSILYPLDSRYYWLPFHYWFHGAMLGLVCMILTWRSLGKNHMQAQNQQHFKPMTRQKHQWQQIIGISPGAKEGLLIGVLVGLTEGLSQGLSEGLNIWLSSGRSGTGQDYGLGQGLSTGLSTGLTTGLSIGLSVLLIRSLLMQTETTIKTVDLLAWSWRGIKLRLKGKSHLRQSIRWGIILLFTFALSFGLSSVLESWLENNEISSGLHDALTFGLPSGLSAASVSLCYWLLVGIFEGVVATQFQQSRSFSPNHGIRRSLRIGLELAIFGGTLCYYLGMLVKMLRTGLFVWLSDLMLEQGNLLSDALGYALHDGFVAAPFIGLFSAILIFLLRGGLAWWRHWLLRFLLWRSGVLPWKMVRFLNEASARILLFKVGGGGYRFIHDLFRDYLASLHAPQPSSPLAHLSEHIEKEQ